MKYEELHNPQSESGIIATLIHNPNFIFHSESLEPRDFFDKTNQALFWAIKEIINSGIDNIDDFTLNAKLASNKAIEERVKSADIQNIKDILELSKYATRSTVEAYKDLVRDVQEFSARRNLYLDSQKLSSACLNLDYKSDNLQKLAFEIAEKHILSNAKNKDLKIFADKIDGICTEIEARQNGELKSLQFPFKTLNRYVELEAGELVIFGANAKIGKSACLLTCVVDLLEKGNCILLIDSELSDRLFALRMLAHISGVDFALVKSGKVNDEQREKIKLAKEKIKTFKFFHEYTPLFNDTELLTLFKRVNSLNKVDLLVVDYFKVTQFGDAFATSLSLAKSVDTVKNEIAGSYDIPALSAIQLTKNGEVAMSAGVARNCSTLISITRKTQKEIEQDGGNSFGNSKFSVLLNRNGEQHNEDEYISVDFHGNTLTYREVEKQPIKQIPY